MKIIMWEWDVSECTHQPWKRSNVQGVNPAGVGVDFSVQNSRHCLVDADLACAVARHHCTFPQFDRWAAHAGTSEEQGHQGGNRTRAKRLIWSKADWLESMRGNEETNESGRRTLSVQMMSKDKLELKGSLRFVMLMNTQSSWLCNSDSIRPLGYQRG